LIIAAVIGAVVAGPLNIGAVALAGTIIAVARRPTLTLIAVTRRGALAHAVLAAISGGSGLR